MYKCDVRRVYVLVHGCVCASHADEMKNVGRLNLCASRTQIPTIRKVIASSPGRQLKFRKKDGLVPIATMLVRMRWPIPKIWYSYT